LLGDNEGGDINDRLQDVST